MKRHLRVLSLMAAALLLLGVVAGCGAPAAAPAASSAAPSTASTPAASASSAADPAAGEELGLPIFAEPTTLRFYAKFNGAMSSQMQDYNGVRAMQEMEARTNVHIEWIHPTGGDEQFALMIGSNDLPDIIDYTYSAAKGGAEVLVRDGVLVTITEDEYRTYMPNYMSIMDANPDVRKNNRLDDGTEFRVSNFNWDPRDNSLPNFIIKGLFMRLDWLEKVGMEAPTTIDEMYAVLTAFKEQDVNGQGNVIPFLVGRINGAGGMESLRALAGAYGTRHTEHMLDGELVYGPITENFRKYLTEMNKWYAEGLINSDFPVLEETQPLMLNGTAASTIGSMGSGLISGRTALLESDPTSDLGSLPYLIGPDGFQCLVDDRGAATSGTTITSANQYKYETMRWLDYMFSEEGSILVTMGIEGESYNFVDGWPVMTDLVLKPPAGVNQENAIAAYAMGPTGSFPYARHIGMYEQVNLDTPFKQKIQQDWATGTTDILIPAHQMNPEETTTYTNIMADIRTYVDEMTIKFIIGDEPLTNFDSFVQNVKDMRIDEALAAKRTAVERWGSMS